MLMIRKPYGEAPTDIDLPATAHAQVVATVAVAQALMDVADAIRSLAPATAQPAHGPLPRA
jgi:hypothetical protein